MRRNYSGILSVLIMLVLSFCFVACSSDDDDGEKSISVPTGQQLSQSVYADEEEGASDVSFTTTAAWTSSVIETTAKSTKDAASQPAPDWITISPDRGDKAGDYTISINLDTNYSGEKRSATIVVNCNGERIEIKITQEATTKEGEILEPPVEIDDELGFIILQDDGQLYFADEKGKQKNMITILTDTCDLYLSNYNIKTNEVYIHRYKYYSDSVAPISEFLAVNAKTGAKKTLVKGVLSYDQAFISADGNYVVYDRIYKNESKQRIIKQSLIDGKETILSESDDIYGGASIRSISKDGATVILTLDNKVMVMVDEAEKYSFTDGTGDYTEAYLSSMEDKLILKYGKSGFKICNLDGSDKEIIRTDDSVIYIESIVLSADGKYIYFDDYSNPAKVYALNIKDKSTETLIGQFPIPYLYKGALSVNYRYLQ